MREDKNMNKMLKSLLLSLFLLASLTAKSQIYISDGDAWNDRNPKTVNEIPVLPQNWDDDWIPDNIYTPIGDGWLLLAGLGGVSLLRKRKKKS